jgi:hypothetical protein
VGYALIWLEFLVAALLWIILVTAWVSRRRSRWVRMVVVALATLVPLAPVVVCAILSTMGFVGATIWWGWLVYVTAWILALAAGAVVVAVKGLRSGEAKGSVRASLWPRGSLALALAVAALLAMMTFWNMDLATRNQLVAVRAEAGAIALSLAPARVPESQNAAGLYDEAFAALQDIREWPNDWQCVNEPGEGATPFDPRDPKLAEALKGQGPALALLRRAAAMPGCYIECDYGRPSIEMLVPNLSRWSQASTVLSLDARAQAAAGRPDAALEDVGTMLRMARHVETGPFVISMLIGLRVETAAFTTLEDVLAWSRPTAAQLAGLDVARPEFHRVLLPRALRMEGATGEATFAMVAGGSMSLSQLVAPDGYPDTVKCFDVFPTLYRVFLLSEDLAAYRDGMQQYQKLVSEPFREARESWPNPIGRGQVFRGGLLTRMLLPGLSGCAPVAVEADARRDLMRVAVAAARYRADKGSLPKNLDDLVPQYLAVVPQDPFDGKPLKMARKDGAAVFYSVGRNFKDDGGAPPSDHGRQGDVTFRLGE